MEDKTTIGALRKKDEPLIEYVKRMALEEGVHPNLIAGSELVRKEAGIGEGELTPELLWELRRETFELAQQWAAKNNADPARKSYCEIKREFWFRVDEKLPPVDNTVKPATEPKAKPPVESVSAGKPQGEKVAAKPATEPKVRKVMKVEREELNKLFIDGLKAKAPKKVLKASNAKVLAVVKGKKFAGAEVAGDLGKLYGRLVKAIEDGDDIEITGGEAKVKPEAKAKAVAKAKPEKKALAAKAAKAHANGNGHGRRYAGLKTGTVLEREYKGKSIKVTVLDDGFRFQSKTYPSLTAVAEEVITKKGKVSGPNFFGVTKP